MSSDKCEVSFYHLSNPVMKALPKLLERIIQSKKRCLVLCSNALEMSDLNDVLWTYASRAFLPHGSSQDLYPEQQPVLLSVDGKNLNAAEVVVVLSATIPEGLDGFERCLDLFYSNNDADEVARLAKQRYSFYQDGGYKMNYWTQNEDGGWVC